MNAKHNHYSGLSKNEVEESRQKYGKNVLTPPKRLPIWKLFLEKFDDPIIRILLIAAFLSLAISFVNGEYAETIGIFCAIFLATGISFWFELDANKKFDILNKVGEESPVKVIRFRNICEIPKCDVVVGDIVLLDTGEEVPADGVLLESVSLQIDESCLTGEPMTNKSENPEYFQKDATYPSNELKMSTKVLNGNAIMQVTLVGDATEYGKVARKATEFSAEKTPLTKDLDRLANLIGFAGFSLAAITFCVLFVKDVFMGHSSYSTGQFGLLAAVIIAVMIALIKVWLPLLYSGFELFGKEKKLPSLVENGSWLKWFLIALAAFAVMIGVGLIFGVNPIDKNSWVSIETAGHILQYFMIAVTLVVVAVPEGLPMSVALSLALNMRRMLQTDNLVRKMHACETMGAITVICTDKTGTLTQNQMSVRQTNFYSIENQNLNQNESSQIIEETIAANTTAHLDFSDSLKVKTIGNPTEAALLLWLNENGINYMQLRENIDIVEQIAFSTERKYMATIFRSPNFSKKILCVKGAPEIVMEKSCKIKLLQGFDDINKYKHEIEMQLLEYQSQAMRTLGFAFLEIEANDTRKIDEILLSENNQPLVFLGVAAISDPVRLDVPDAVNKCMSAGINVKIVTGDTPATAKEIARQIGIWNLSDNINNIISGVEFEALSDEEALKRVKSLKIMCRARPTDKQRLVQLLQQRGEVVAVTGDGTNDAPALNYAHVGLSMGSGTSVAKEASDITLLSNSFASIATAVMWGRSLYKNIQRFILFQLTINVVALTIVLLGSIFGHELPLTVTQMLWVNLIMDTFAAAALASLPPNPNVMSANPRRRRDFIISPPMRAFILIVGFIFVAILMFLLYWFTDANGNISTYNLSLFFTIFVMLQFWNLFNAKAFSSGKSAFADLRNSKSFLIVAAVIIVGQFLIVEFGGKVFRTEPLLLKDWILIIALTSIVLWVGELLRFFDKKTNAIKRRL